MRAKKANIRVKTVKLCKKSVVRSDIHRPFAFIKQWEQITDLTSSLRPTCMCWRHCVARHRRVCQMHECRTWLQTLITVSRRIHELSHAVEQNSAARWQVVLLPVCGSETLFWYIITRLLKARVYRKSEVWYSMRQRFHLGQKQIKMARSLQSFDLEKNAKISWKDKLTNTSVLEKWMKKEACWTQVGNENTDGWMLRNEV